METRTTEARRDNTGLSNERNGSISPRRHEETNCRSCTDRRCRISDVNERQNGMAAEPRATADYNNGAMNASERTIDPVRMVRIVRIAYIYI